MRLNPKFSGTSLSEKAESDIAEARAREVLGQAVLRHVGRMRQVRTADAAERIGCSEGLLRQMSNTESGLKSRGEARLLQMIAALGPDFANDLLKPYGMEVRPAPDALRVHPLEVAEACGSQVVLIVQHLQDNELDIPELLAQDAMLRQHLTLLRGYAGWVRQALVTGRPIDMLKWGAA